MNIAATAVDGALGTRDAVVQLVLSQGPITAAELATTLQLSVAGIRRHLDALEQEGAITSRLQQTFNPRGRGRPARVYLLTESGRARLPHAYDDLAVQALEFLAETGGPAAVTEFARRRAAMIVASRRAELDAAPDVPARVRILAGALTESGYAASIGSLGSGTQLCQHHCPVAHVAERFPQLCEAEMNVFTEALGTYAQRLATIARGDSFCTTFVPAVHSTRTVAELPMPEMPARHLAAAAAE